jgi:hypothetical protein
MAYSVYTWLAETHQSLFSQLQRFNVAFTLTVSASPQRAVIENVALSTTDIALNFRLSFKKNTKQIEHPEKEKEENSVSLDLEKIFQPVN